ncbi:uncharacterized protein LOC121797086 [Salvia splendens]|uniref:uncharacterized protein LOC121797086 n=1 Tax=Salvia splendens TaxID=180675 RepID=UPI001C276148|nr:uncharacterized protein LOC121797086 [Salvia splendens]
MDESFTVQISSNLVKKLLDDGETEKVKKKTRKPRQKNPQQPQAQQVPGDLEALGGPSSTAWPIQPSLYPPPPLPSHKPPNSNLEAIRSVLEESEKVVERLRKNEENMLQEVTERAKGLHDKEFELRNSKPIPCLDEKIACLNCYKEHINDPLKCAQLVRYFANCARTVRRQVGHGN